MQEVPILQEVIQNKTTNLYFMSTLLLVYCTVLMHILIIASGKLTFSVIIQHTRGLKTYSL